ncbi:nucleotidyltransferase family protein [Clostridium sp.]|uniref:nucleotidyltransferase family protein n=1 Tax=Clostridium sp. TaxID=1506 RepID=UPI002627FAE2|nr:nucleotidyltransferase family protein [Clostridium sp.]
MKINLILLAAGNSSRFEGNKLLTIINNKPMYMNAIDIVSKISFNKIIVVTQYEEIKAALSKYNMEVIMNYNSELGISHSIKLGVQSSKDADAYMFMVCDQPFISLESIEELVNEFVKGHKGLACVEYKGNLCNPTIFSNRYKNDLLNLKGDIGGKYIINKNLDDLVTTEIYDKLEVTDIDTKKELYDIEKKR